LARLLDGIRLELPGNLVVLNSENITGLIRSPEVTAASAAVANSPVVRRRMIVWQRAIAQGRNMVCEGRAPGALVFPEAQCKFFLVAEPRERARRRHLEMQLRGEQVPFDDILQAQEARDRRDAARDIAPMVPATDAMILDSTLLSLEHVVGRMEEE